MLKAYQTQVVRLVVAVLLMAMLALSIGTAVVSTSLADQANHPVSVIACGSGGTSNGSCGGG